MDWLEALTTIGGKAIDANTQRRAWQQSSQLELARQQSVTTNAAAIAQQQAGQRQTLFIVGGLAVAAVLAITLLRR